jgi:hypothetical protein
MKRLLTLILALAFVWVFDACDTVNSVDTAADLPGIGEIHTEFLEAVFQNLDNAGPNRTSQAEDEEYEFELLYTTAIHVMEKYGLPPLSRQEVRDALERGYKMALSDPVQLVRDALPADQYEWWDTFASQATIETVEAVYEETCRVLGPPQSGTMLQRLVDISRSSSVFWNTRHTATRDKNDPFIQYNWKKRVLRFAVNIVVDGVAGGLAGAGAGGNVVAAGIVGGLSSYGADKILFGD